MYRDVSQLNHLFFETYSEANEFIDKINPRPILKYGFEYISHHEHLIQTDLSFDAMYYHLANIPLSKRWDDFYVKRDIDREMKVFEQYKVKEKTYTFVHDTYSTENPKMKTEFITDLSSVIKPSEKITNNIFDYLYLIEHSKEIHCVCSSFKNLIDSFDNITVPLYFHKNRGSFKHNKKWISTCKLPWIHIEYF
jgi:hypothetical protein